MKSLLQALAWYADTVLSICYPLETKPGLDDAAALADKEAQEDVAEPMSITDWGGDLLKAWKDWPEQPDPLGHIVALLEDIHNILQRSPLLMPDNLNPVEAPANPGPPKLRREVADTAAFAIEEWMAGRGCAVPDHWRKFVDELYAYDAALKATQ